MRITLDMAAELVRAAQARAAERGETVEDLVTRALARELSAPARPARSRRLSLPLIGREATPGASVTNADSVAALDAEDIARYAAQ